MCLQHRILGFANWTAVNQHSTLLQHFGICHHQDAPSESWKDRRHLVPRPHTSWQTAAMLQQFQWECLGTYTVQPWLYSKWHLSFQSSEEASWWSLIPNCCGSASRCFTVFLFARPRVLCWRYTCTDNALWQIRDPWGWLCGKVGHCSVFSWEMLFWIQGPYCPIDPDINQLHKVVGRKWYLRTEYVMTFTFPYLSWNLYSVIRLRTFSSYLLC